MSSYSRLSYDILDGMIDWVRVIGIDGSILYANKTIKDDLGKDIVGNKCYSVLGRNIHCKKCITEMTMKTGKVSEKEEIVGDRIFSVKSSPVRDENGKIYAAVEVFRDVTRERKLEKQLIKKNKKMSNDLDFARTLQEKILPAKGNYITMNIDYLYRPSEMLSGDMFDVFDIDENHVGVYISDVVGHGVTASMMTMFIRQTMRAVSRRTLSPSETLSRLHKKFLALSLEDDKYFTIFYGIIDNRDNTFRYVNGGHNSIPILVKDEDIELLESKGYPICTIFDKIEYHENVVKLSKGDKVLFYTDGIIEAKNRKSEEFGIDRLIDIIKNEKNNLIKRIEKEIDKFSYESQVDDIAIIEIELL